MLFYLICCSLVLQVACNFFPVADTARALNANETKYFQHCLSNKIRDFCDYDTFCVINITSISSKSAHQGMNGYQQCFEIHIMGNSGNISNSRECTDDTLPIRKMIIDVIVSVDVKGSSDWRCSVDKRETKLFDGESLKIRSWAKSHVSDVDKAYRLDHEQKMAWGGSLRSIPDEDIVAWFPHAPWLHESDIQRAVGKLGRFRGWFTRLRGYRRTREEEGSGHTWRLMPSGPYDGSLEHPEGPYLLIIPDSCS